MTRLIDFRQVKILLLQMNNSGQGVERIKGDVAIKI